MNDTKPKTTRARKAKKKIEELANSIAPEEAEFSLQNLRWLCDLRATVQKQRIAMGNRGNAETATPSLRGQAFIKKYSDEFTAIEEKLDEDIKAICFHFPIIERATNVVGLGGGLLVSKVISQIDIVRAEHISNLWRYAGYATIEKTLPDGTKVQVREHHVKGEKAHYNQDLKTACYLVATSFMKCNSPYRAIYDKAKVKYQNTHKDWTKLHVHNAATGDMIKKWLSHLWLEWRKLEGLSISDPYIIGKDGHSHIDKPQDFGWPE